ncbi:MULTISPECIES: DNA translocase FtsK [Pontibacillus]|uniref:DNA translocase FtsK n=1 Tax=Pontibacillus chungwhensis TaxID=265426 RepID=A0ABY8V052_9BACI|nr:MULTISPECIES: DNA translocase FtsK [Pontibacillus]MCD5323899.1 DNA translocase FtsK [Pontibacillus sp. HN14]WIF97256.1 DNA translocase FtsK [Pontibacillus chungwhensis]
MKNWLHQMRQEEQSPEDRQPPFPQEDETKHQKQQNQQQFQTKMMYQYPKQGNFRFPMIPDRQQEREPRKNYQRNTEQKNEEKNRKQNQRSSYESYKYSSSNEEKEWSKKDTYKPSSFDQGSPFTPSNVPSPIYGYGKREGHFSETVLDELPSFMKKTDEDDRLYESTLAKVLPETHPSSFIPEPVSEEEPTSSQEKDEPEIVEEPEKDNVVNFHMDEEQEQEYPPEEELSVVYDEDEDEDEDVPPTIIMYGSRNSEDEALEEDDVEEIDEEPTSVKEQESEAQGQELPPSTLEMDAQEEVSHSEDESVSEDEYTAYGMEDHQQESKSEDMLVEQEESLLEMETDENDSEWLDEEDDHPSDTMAFDNIDETFDAGVVEQLDTDGENESSVEQPETNRENESSVEHDRSELEDELEAEEVSEVNQESQEEVHPSEEEDAVALPHSAQQESEEEVAATQATAEEQRPKRRSRPFNVIMTPRDKRNRDQQKQAPSKTSAQEEMKEEVKVDEEEKEEHKVEEQIEKQLPVQSTIPPYHLLNDPPARVESEDEWIEEQMQLLETTLHNFHVKAKVVNAMKGPAVTRFEVQPEPGVKVSKITNLSDDIKMSLAAKDIRMEAPIPGKNAIGIEVPNQKSEAVGLQEILESDAFQGESSPLSVGLGLDIEGSPIVTDLKKMPHGLIAGATGSGKSVCINTILVSLLYKASHEDVKFLLIDPKMVELAPYNELPHLVAPVITDVKAATSALKWAVKEMEQRYERFVEEGVRDIDRYNDKMKAKGRLNDKMPYLVIVIDELADLMMMSPQDVEDAICRIAQKARACGIHLLLATQRPSVDVITGLIKANIPTRVAFSVSSQVDSRTIVDAAGAEKLLGRGDMLFLENGAGKTKRIQGAFVSDDEIERITNYVKKIASPNYLFEQEELMQQPNFEEAEDDLFEEAVQFVIDQNGASASLLQRRFKVGYNRAARLIDTMEEKGIISESKGSKPRDVYIDHAGFEELRREHE